MSNPKEVKFPLKVMMNKHSDKVLFAEADSDFADVLLSFLTLPLGTIVRVLNMHYKDKAPVFGSLTTLYNGLSNLGTDNFWSEGGKQMLLNPRNSSEAECRKLKINIDDTEPTKYFRCGNRDCSNKRSPLISMYHNMVKCDCGNFLSKAMGAIESKSTEVDNDGDDGGVFTKRQLTFFITDDLKIAPVVPGSIIQTLVDLGITITSGAELRNFTLGFNDIIVLLRGSLLSSTPLTDLILPKRCGNHDYIPGDQPHRINEKSSSDAKKMTVKAILRKSDNTLLFAQTEDDFVDFLFSLLVIPLGGVEHLLDSNTWLKNIDNLYKSIIANLVDDDKYLRTRDIKSRLIKPELAPNYLSKNDIFSLNEQMNPSLYFFESVKVSADYTVEKGFWMQFKDPKGRGSYVKRPRTFMVSDDLNVKRIDSVDSVLDLMDIGLSDVKEVELHIGLEEALNILKASLTSKTSLSDGLINLTQRSYKSKNTEDGHRGFLNFLKS